MLHIKFQAPGWRGFEKEGFWTFSYVFLWFEPRTPWPRAILDPGTFIWTNLVKDHYEMLHTKFQASEPSGSEEEGFWIYFYAFLWFQPGTSWPGAILNPGIFVLNKLGKGPLGNAIYQISSIWAKWLWRRRFLNIHCSAVIPRTDRPRKPV